MDRLSAMLQQAPVYLQEGVDDPAIFKAVFLAGGPASGKSFVSGRTTAGLGFRIVNSDDMFVHLLRKAGLGLDMTKFTPDQMNQRDLIRADAKAKTSKRLSQYVHGRLGIIMDGTGQDFKKIKQQLKLRYIVSVAPEFLDRFADESPGARCPTPIHRGMPPVQALACPR